ncbi:MAG: hypothetical protein OHK93_001165 [Ramalina farinacea]|uniref:Uncharacterized protein n=1 Tax=Ramalina farinacea TaxID=258253 RepID=A0AA43QNY1_9LECA|nr:hypothetical protein [Ramalina farinacea]
MQRFFASTDVDCVMIYTAQTILDIDQVRKILTHPELGGASLEVKYLKVGELYKDYQPEEENAHGFVLTFPERPVGVEYFDWIHYRIALLRRFLDHKVHPQWPDCFKNNNLGLVCTDIEFYPRKVGVHVNVYINGPITTRPECKYKS